MSNMCRAVKVKEFLEMCGGGRNISVMGFKFGSPIQKNVLHLAELRWEGVSNIRKNFVVRHVILYDCKVT